MLSIRRLDMEKKIRNARALKVGDKVFDCEVTRISKNHIFINPKNSAMPSMYRKDEVQGYFNRGGIR